MIQLLQRYCYRAVAIAATASIAPTTAAQNTPRLIRGHEIVIQEAQVPQLYRDLVDLAYAKITWPTHFDPDCIIWTEDQSRQMREISSSARTTGDDQTGIDKIYIVMKHEKLDWIDNWPHEVQCKQMEAILRHELAYHIPDQTLPSGKPDGGVQRAGHCSHAEAAAETGVNLVCKKYIKELMEFYGCNFPLPMDAHEELNALCEWYVRTREASNRGVLRALNHNPPIICHPTAEMNSVQGPCVIRCVHDSTAFTLTLCN